MEEPALPTVTKHYATPDAHSDVLWQPRDDSVIRERAVGATFEAAEGPFSVWVRTLREDGSVLTETIHYRTSVRYWGWLFDLALRPSVATTPNRGPQWWRPTDRLTQHQADALGCCAVLSMMFALLGGIVVQTLTYASQDLGNTAWDQSKVLTIVRLGAIVTVAITAAGDRVGRIRALRIALWVSMLGNVASAISPSLMLIGVAQWFGRGAAAAGIFLIGIICAEVLPARSRSYGVAVLLLPGGIGIGVLLAALPFIQSSEWAWRLFYCAALPAGIIGLRALRHLSEPQRFTAAVQLTPRAQRSSMAAETTSRLPTAARINLRRFIALAALLVALNAFTAPTQQLQNDYLNVERAFSPGRVSLFLVATNIWGGIGVVVGSQMSDRSSRRLAAWLGLMGLAGGSIIMFSFGGWLMWLGSALSSVIGGMFASAIGAMLPEMFPTIRRGTSNGLLNGFGVGGSALGLLITGHLVTTSGYAKPVQLLGVALVVAAFFVWLLPESAGHELEELNHE